MRTAIPNDANTYRTLRDQGLDVVVSRLSFTTELPPGALKVAEDECVIAFSRKCTHMGCSLLPEAKGAALPLPNNSGLVRCPCHSSCFDVVQKGLVVGGPATEYLPIHELRPVFDPTSGQITAVELVGWHRWGSVGRGVPYGGTDAAPNGG